MKKQDLQIEIFQKRFFGKEKKKRDHFRDVYCFVFSEDIIVQMKYVDLPTHVYLYMRMIEMLHQISL